MDPPKLPKLAGEGVRRGRGRVWSRGGAVARVGAVPGTR